MFYRKWDDTSIMNHIMSKHGKKPINSSYFATNYPAVYAAAERIFGSWKNAIEACGLDCSTIRKRKQFMKSKIGLIISDCNIFCDEIFDSHNKLVGLNCKLRKLFGRERGHILVVAVAPQIECPTVCGTKSGGDGSGPYVLLVEPAHELRMALGFKSLTECECGNRLKHGIVYAIGRTLQCNRGVALPLLTEMLSKSWKI